VDGWIDSTEAAEAVIQETRSKGMPAGALLGFRQMQKIDTIGLFRDARRIASIPTRYSHSLASRQVQVWSLLKLSNIGARILKIPRTNNDAVILSAAVVRGETHFPATSHQPPATSRLRPANWLR
jgi:hypothetical protein